MKRRRGRNTASAVPTMLMIAFALAVLVGIAILIAADQDAPPPVSTMAYEDRPADHRARGPADFEPLNPRPDQTDPADPETTASPGVEMASDEPGAPEAEAAFTITGTVTDGDTGEAVSNALLVARRVPTQAEEAAHEELDRRARESKQGDAIAAALDEEQRIRADASAQSGPDGRFQIPIAVAGDYTITVQPRHHLRKTIEKEFVGESRPEWTLRIEVSTGASISGRVTDSLDNRGIGGIEINVTHEETRETKRAETDDEGRYTAGGLSPGDYAVVAHIERTAYRVTKVLPYRKATITGPEEAVRNVNFQLDKGGVVWGYVTTPDGDPVQSRVVLTTSDSVLSQAISAMVRQAPPLSDSSRAEDGYYELLGVPLNEEWRLYATAEDQAPQLADPFVVTPRNKEVRVDITVFNGSNVHGQVVTAKGQPVPEARVIAFPSYGQLMAPMENAQAAREEQSDADGYFTIPELPAGNYQVMAHKEGYKYTLKGTPLYANGFHDVKNFRVVIEAIESGDYAVYGTVSDANGRAVPDARVILSGVGTESLQGVGRDTQTDSGGDFRFDGVEIGTYMLAAEKAGYSRKTLGRVLLDEPNEIVLRAAAVVRGRVLVADTNQAPETGYTVGAVKLSGEDDSGQNLFSLLDGAGDGARNEDFNDPQGHYELSLAAGAWQLEGRAQPLAPGRAEVTLQPGDVIEDIDLILSSDGSTIEGFVYTTDGESPQGATVSLIEAGSASQALTMFAQDSGGLQSTQVASDGAFTFERLPAGTYFAVARHPAYPQAMSPSITLEANDTASGVEIGLGPGGALEGYVFDGGQPAAGWVVTVIANGQPYTGTTSADGSYEIRNIPEGEFQAFATNPGAGLNLDALGGQGYPVEIRSGSTTSRNFGEFEGITVHVTVFRAAGDTGLPGGLENIGARVVLNPAAVIPVIGTGIDAGAIPGEHYTMGGQTVSIPDVAPGAWRVDYYELARTGTYRWRGVQDFEVTGEEPEVTVDLFANQ